MYPYSTALAQALQKVLVFFDLEHTGGPKYRATEIGAVMLAPDGTCSEFSALVRPPEGTYFQPFVVKLTGITKASLADKPTWQRVHHELVLPYKDAIWVGFGSKGTDLPLVHKESLALGEDLSSQLLHLDLYGLGDVQGKLTDRVAQLWPGTDTSNAHRALADAHYTALLLEGLLKAGLPLLADINSGRVNLVYEKPIPKAERVKPKRAPATFDRSFFSDAPGSRIGLGWTPSEQNWIVSRWGKGDSIDALAARVGRTAVEVGQWLKINVSVPPATQRAHHIQARRASLR